LLPQPQLLRRLRRGPRARPHPRPRQGHRHLSRRRAVYRVRRPCLCCPRRPRRSRRRRKRCREWRRERRNRRQRDGGQEGVQPAEAAAADDGRRRAAGRRCAVDVARGRPAGARKGGKRSGVARVDGSAAWRRRRRRHAGRPLQRGRSKQSRAARGEGEEGKRRRRGARRGCATPRGARRVSQRDARRGWPARFARDSCTHTQAIRRECVRKLSGERADSGNRGDANRAFSNEEIAGFRFHVRGEGGGG
jgi:hypothetical protein